MTTAADGWMIAAVLSTGEESPGFMKTRYRLMTGEGDLRESATENKPPLW